MRSIKELIKIQLRSLQRNNESLLEERIKRPQQDTHYMKEYEKQQIIMSQRNSLKVIYYGLGVYATLMEENL